MAQLTPGLLAKPIAHTVRGPVSSTGLNIAGVNGHARHARKSRLCFGHGSSVVCLVAAVEPDIIEETVEAVAVIEQPGSLPSTQFAAFDQATGLVENLEVLNAQMAELIQKASIAVEVQQETSRWTGDTLPEDVQKKFLSMYREQRKEEQQERKAKRNLKSVLRAVGRSFGEQLDLPAGSLPFVSEPAPAADIQQQQQQSRELPLQPQTLSDAEERRAKRAQQREQRVQSTAAPALPTAEQELPTASVPAAAEPPAQRRQRAQALPAQRSAQPAAQQRAGRQRRRRGSTTAAASVAAAPAPLQTDSSVQDLEQQRQQPAAHNRGGPAGPRPAVAAVAEAAPVATAPMASAVSVAPAGLAAAVSTGSSSRSSSSITSLAIAPQQEAARGFQPLSLQQSSIAAPRGRSPVNRRAARAAGISRTKAVATAPAPAAPPAPVDAASNLPKLVDNNLHGLDMRADLLTAEQEKELAVMVQDLLKLEEIQKELIQTLGRLPTELEWMEAVGVGPQDNSEDEYEKAVHAFHARLTHGRTAKQVMISANYKLVASISRKYQGYGMSLSDLINEGIAGLVKGVEKFEPSKGCKFSTYAHWWIRQAITRSLSEQGRLVRLPSHMQELLTKMTRISKVFESQYGREPTLAELSHEMGVDAHKLQDVYDSVFTPRSLDAPMNDGEGATLGDVIEDDRLLGAEDAAYMESLKADLEAVLLTLPPREAGVLRMRFGLLDGTEHTLDEIGAQYNVTRERIRQIEAKAIRQLRARQSMAGSVMSDYQAGGMESKELASRTSSGTKKQG
eukprot:GHUV01000953.1.p1 GENE.GHUV01000953.1~~GHUV01000953.1.p1  ORF type:complete len:791 (+),score=297.65 GHUV01000953.1:282-2654(+)